MSTGESRNVIRFGPTDRDGRAHFYAAPRGYAVYALKN